MTAHSIDLLTEDEAAKALGLSAKTLRGIRKRGEIAYIRVTAKMIRYRQKEIDDYLDAVTRVDEPAPGPGAPAREITPLTDMPKRPCVYFVRSGMTGPIKIGCAKTLRPRLHALSTAHHEKLFLLATLAGGVVQEQRLHAQFDHLRIRGEWFQPAEDLLSYIDTIREPFA